MDVAPTILRLLDDEVRLHLLSQRSPGVFVIACKALASSWGQMRLPLSELPAPPILVHRRPELGRLVRVRVEIDRWEAAACSEARQALVDKMEADAMVDAAGIVSNFQRMVRIADSTGIPSEAPMLLVSEDFCEPLGIDKYVSAANTENPSFLKRLFLKFVAVRQFRKMIRGFGKDK